MAAKVSCSSGYSVTEWVAAMNLRRRAAPANDGRSCPVLDAHILMFGGRSIETRSSTLGPYTSDYKPPYTLQAKSIVESVLYPPPRPPIQPALSHVPTSDIHNLLYLQFTNKLTNFMCIWFGQLLACAVLVMLYNVHCTYTAIAFTIPYIIIQFRL